MKTEDGNWKEFELWASKLRGEFSGRSHAGLLFRGQANSEWSLDTTLERHGQRQMLVSAYYMLAVAGIGPAVETFTGVSAPKFDPAMLEKFRSIEYFFKPDKFPSGRDYEYLVYLRHHGFPSPLLDWTRSPYVAAFFAFRDEHPESGRRSIYAYCETPHGTKGGAVGEPTIRSLGPYVRSHPRHFRQQSVYTVCESLSAGHIWQYDSHQYAFDHSRPDQDYLWRFDIPSQQRVEILRTLDDLNLNAFSLFDSQESLLETMWLREQVFNPIPQQDGAAGPD